MGDAEGAVGQALSAARRAILDTLYPPRCAGCDRRGHWICEACFPTAELLREPVCARCGGATDAGFCRCATVSFNLSWLRSGARYGGWVRQALIRFKYGGESARAPHLADLMAPWLDLLGQIDGFVPVPLHRSRQRERGFNQAERLAAALSRRHSVPISGVVLRVRRTETQVGLDAKQRQSNVAGAFAVTNAASIRGSRLLLIDDVMTTGATLGACADALVDAGALWVGGLTVAREEFAFSNQT